MAAPSKQVDVDKILVRPDLVPCQVFSVGDYKKKRSSLSGLMAMGRKYSGACPPGEMLKFLVLWKSYPGKMGMGSC